MGRPGARARARGDVRLKLLHVAERDVAHVFLLVDELVDVLVEVLVDLLIDLLA